MCEQGRLTAVLSEGAHRLWKWITEWAALGSPFFVSTPIRRVADRAIIS
jgi:hypothetical protein